MMPVPSLSLMTGSSRSGAQSVKNRRPSRRSVRGLRALSFGLAVAALSSTAHAASGTWTNGDATNVWQDSNNWSATPFPGGTTAAFTSTDAATFSTTGSGTITLGGTGLINVQTIFFGTGGGDASTFTVGASTDVFDITAGSGVTTAGGVIINAGVTHAEQVGVAGTTINLTTTTGLNSNFFNNGTGLLTIGGNIVGNTASGATDNLIFGGTGTGNITVSGNISSATAGTVTFVRDGSSTNTVTLNGTTTTNNGVFLARSGVTNINGAVNTGTGLFEVGGSNGTALSGGTVNIAANVTANNMNIGNANGANFRTGAVYQTAGTVSITQAANGTNFQLGNSAVSTTTPALGSGYYRLSGGSVTANEIDVGSIVAGTATTGSVGVMEVNGGTATSNGYLTVGRGSGISSGTVNVFGGTFNTGATSTLTGPIALNWASAAGAQSVLTVGGGAGAAAVTGAGSTTQTAQFAGDGLNLAESNTAGTAGIANLLTNGTLTVPDVVASQGATSTSQLNFNGGTLKATATNLGATFLASANINSINVFRSGGTIDNSGTNITVANALLAPAGYGATSGTTITVPNGGSGYVGAPLVKLTGGSGVGATGYATVSGGVVTGIVITSRGVGYASTDTLTATFFGGLGNGGTAATAVTGLAVSVNQSGGMTFTGAGTTTLSGANTYTGATAVNTGILLLTATGSLSSTAINVTAAGGLTLQGTATLPDTALLTLVAGTKLNLGAASGSETIGSLSLDGNFVPVGTYTAAQLAARDASITFTSAGETLTVTSVPEPSTWAMLLGGVAGLAGGLVRRKRRA